MLSDKIKRLPVKTREGITDLFVYAALSYELGGDWKKIFRLQLNKSVGTTKQFCAFWLRATASDMEKAITVFLEDIHKE